MIPLFVSSVLATAAEPPGPPDEGVKLSGSYSAWGLTQRNFMLGADHPLDDALYTVQVLRTRVDAHKGKVGATARIDLGQGWWGVDNSSNTRDVSGVDGDGNPVESNVYNENALFENKDTMYTVHVDLAYGWAEFEPGGVPVRLQIGRQFYGVGHKLVLDQDHDGVTATIEPVDALAVTILWAKVGEGRDAIKDPTGLLMSDVDAYRDADLAGLQGVLGKAGAKHRGEAFALFYADRSEQDDWTLLPNGLGYLNARFQPNVSSAMAFGVAADGKVSAGKDDPGFGYEAEVDVLAGKDLVDNPDHAGGLLDKNNGQLFGYNAYLSGRQEFDLAKGFDLGATLGYGSGDPDKTRGPGNLNKIQTMGFFPFTNVWEDSVMPDVEGISPQGIGSPVSRGYREFESTFAALGRVGVSPVEPLRLEVAYAYLLATAPVHGFDATGTPTAASATDLGSEVDANATVRFGNGLLVEVLSGVFLPGEAGALLVNGNTANRDPAWEVKTSALVKF